MSSGNKLSQIAIVGGGPIGLAFALAAAAIRDVNVTLVERQTLALARLSSHFDHRVYALSPGSKSLLENLGVWTRIPESRVQPVHSMHVFGDAVQDAEVKSHIDFEAGMPVAFIVEHSALMQALIAQVRDAKNTEKIHLLDNESVDSVEFATASIPNKMALASGGMINADLLVAADGAHSPLRAMAGIAVQIKDYESDGVVANFVAEKPHGGIARQWFSNEGVLAYLPLPVLENADLENANVGHTNQISIVYSVGKTRSDALARLDDVEFAAAIAAAGDHALGDLKLVSLRAGFPLRRVMAQHWVQPGFALMGDAAHAIHPLAGQGANLGFADIRTMHKVLKQRSIFSGIGDLAVLRQYERSRREDALTMGIVTDNLRALFLSDSSAMIELRRAGLKMANKMSVTKSMMMSHAMK